MKRRVLGVVLLGVASLALLLGLTGCAMMPQDPVDNQAAAQANARLGLDFLGKGQYEQAIDRLQRALKYDSDNVTATWGMALVYQNTNQPDRARSYYDRILDGHNRPAILNSYAVFLCQQGQTDEAIDYFKRAANDRRNASPAVALANAGLCLERSGKKETARDYYRKALTINKNQPTALTQMAQIQYAQGQYLSARAFIERADATVNLNPKLLLLAARVELALGDRDAARLYLRRHNKSKPSAAMTLQQLERSS